MYWVSLSGERAFSKWTIGKINSYILTFHSCVLETMCFLTKATFLLYDPNLYNIGLNHHAVYITLSLTWAWWGREVGREGIGLSNNYYCDNVLNGSEHGLHTTRATYGNVVIFTQNLHPSLPPSLPSCLPAYRPAGQPTDLQIYLLNFIESFLCSMRCFKGKGMMVMHVILAIWPSVEVWRTK